MGNGAMRQFTFRIWSTMTSESNRHNLELGGPKSKILKILPVRMSGQIPTVQ